MIDWGEFWISLLVFVVLGLIMAGIILGFINLPEAWRPYAMGGVLAFVIVGICFLKAIR